ncbi:hypothetical protein RYD26_10550 [Pasteurellaceae bacterium LIM206]|nr:hypothetical protein [Pasteurellaceae bacterium LIM206]
MKKWFVSLLGAGILAVAGLIFIGCDGMVEEKADSLDQLSSGMQSWLPAFLPRTATNIHIRTQAESNMMSMRFDLDPAASAQLEQYRQAELTEVGYEQFAQAAYNSENADTAGCYFSATDPTELYLGGHYPWQGRQRYTLVFKDKQYWHSVDELCRLK